MKSCWQVAHQFKISIENFLLLERNALSFYVSENFIICVWVSSNELSTNSAVAQINSKFCKNRESITIFEDDGLCLVITVGVCNTVPLTEHLTQLANKLNRNQ